ncbi:MAG: GIY-YIG nuclease family protein, partial [Cyanobacteria bacterium]|nr:GIY-YIG nuclease family protein [Cyanobacteriota bacterium]
GLPFEIICTFEIARRLYPNLPSRGIRALGGFVGLDMDEVKRAPSHVKATMLIWRHLVEKLSSEGIRNLNDLEGFLLQKAPAKRKKLEFPLLDRLKRLNLPESPGVYRMLSQSGRVFYVGKATSLKSRVNSHFRGRKKSASRSFELLTQVADISYTECGSPLEAALLESDEIKQFAPAYNTSLKAGERRLLFCNREFSSGRFEADSEHQVGPFPNWRAMQAVFTLSETITSGTVSDGIIFDLVDPDVLVEGVYEFVARHASVFADGTSPRRLIALGLRLFRENRRIKRNLQREAREQKAPDILADNFNSDDSTAPALQSPEPVLGDDELLQDLSSLDDELTPIEVADKIDSILVGVARTYLVSRELNSLLNCDIDFVFESVNRRITLREGRICSGSHDPAEGINPSKAWVGADLSTYDRMRVLLSEVCKMVNAGEQVEIAPPVRLLSRI